MILRKFVAPALALFLGVTGTGIIRAAGVAQGQHFEYAQDRDAWDAPPHEWKEI